MSHDIDDGLKSGFIKFEDLENLSLWKKLLNKVTKIENEEVWVSRLVGNLIDMMSQDIYEASNKRIEEHSIKSYEDVSNSKAKIIDFSSEFFKEKEELRHFLFDNLYHHQSVLKMNKKGQEIIGFLFNFLLENPEEIPEHYREHNKKPHHLVRDYIAGMTDNFAEDLFTSHQA